VKPSFIVFNMLCFLFVYSNISGDAKGASFEVSEVPADCVIKMKGVLKSGDLNLFKEALDIVFSLETPPDSKEDSVIYMCLDSIGGSLEEAISIVDVMTASYDEASLSISEYESRTLARHVGTRIESGAKCLSACALIFMAGGTDTQTIRRRVPNRLMHVNSKLGFHAPSLRLGADKFDRKQVDSAYGIARDQIARIMARSVNLRLKTSLITLLLATPPNDMFYVSTVGQAARWGIDLYGYRTMKDFSHANFYQACKHIWNFVGPETKIIEDYENKKIIDEYFIYRSLEYWEPEESEYTNFDFELDHYIVDDGYYEFKHDEEIPCQGQYSSEYESGTIDVPLAWAGYVEFRNWHFLPGKTPINQIERTDENMHIEKNEILVSEQFLQESICLTDIGGMHSLGNCDLRADRMIDAGMNIILEYTFSGMGFENKTISFVNGIIQGPYENLYDYDDIIPAGYFPTECFITIDSKLPICFDAN